MVPESRAGEPGPRDHWTEASFRALVQHASDVITILDADGLVVYQSPAILSVLGYTPQELIGTDPFLLIHPADVAEIRDLFREVAGVPGATATARFRFRHKDGSWHWLDVICTNLLDDPGVTGFVVNSRDVTDRQRVEEQLRESERHHRALNQEARRQAREIALLDEVRVALARDLELPDLIRTVVDGIARTFGYSLVSLYLREGDVLVMQHQVGYARQIERIHVTEGIAGRVVRTGEPVLLADVRADPTFLGAIPGIVSEICVPLHDEGRVAGLLNLESTDETPLAEADLRLLVALSQHVSVAIGRARLYTELRQSEARFRALVQHAADMMSVLDADGIQTYASPAYERILGYRPDELVGTPMATISAAGPGEPDDLGFDLLARRSDAAHRFEAPVRHRDGSIRWLEMIAVNRLADPDLRGIVVTSRDVTENRALQAGLWHQAHHDPLTGLPNRTFLLERLDAALNRHGHATRADPAPLLFLDFDGFKRVNDRLGHDTGDSLLRDAARRLARSIRPVDFIARYGGDEFAVLLAPGTDAEAAAGVAGRLVDDMARPFEVDGHAVTMSVSVGIVVAPGITGRADRLRAADVAHYRAKAMGKGAMVLYDPAHDHLARVPRS
jgi:diguanylate cyclase (GGDEF)-like protein/PAS domain S-box-containing protein